MKNPRNNSNDDQRDEKIPWSTSLMFIRGKPRKMFMNKEKVNEAWVSNRNHDKPWAAD